MNRIIIDTDIGDDIDDALAVQMALNSPEIELVGITTVLRSPWKRAQIALHLLHVNNRADVPVVVGASKPLFGNWDAYYEPCQYIDDLMSGYIVNKGQGAPHFLVEQAALFPQQITIAAIGPLTNIAEAIRRSDSFTANVKAIVLMGGVYSYHYNEWNIKCDPEAAKIVFDSGIPITMVGLDVTMKCAIGVQEAIQMLKQGKQAASALLVELVESWRKVAKDRPIICHDLLVIAELIDASIMQKAKKRVDIETLGQYTRGMTVTLERPFGEPEEKQPNVHVCIDVDSSRALRLFKERIF
jgi:purine nucleosidase/pyrimidine-specific ribonucleoside hydrolase